MITSLGFIIRTVIERAHFKGGSNIDNAPSETPDKPVLAQILRDLVDDISSVQLPKVVSAAVGAIAAMTSADAAGGDSPTEAEYNALRADVVALRARLVETQALLNEVRTNVNAAGRTATAASVVCNNAQAYDLSSGSGYTFTFELAGVALSVPVSAANIAQYAANPAAVTAAELVDILEASGLKRRGVVPSVSGGTKVALTTDRKGVAVTLNTFAGTLETVLNFTGGVATAGTGYQPLVAKA